MVPLQRRGRVMGMKTRNEFLRMIPQNGIAIELGVASGKFSEYLLENSKRMALLFSVDRWSCERGHNDYEYYDAVSRLHKFGVRSIVLRMSFDRALPLFPDETFDFVYIDGYAHQGEQNGIFDQWLPKIRKGGILGGHDYSAEWPLVTKAVDEFISRHDLDLHVTEESTNPTACVYPSWYVIR
jgi:predicted O-methyltransferase YrrM